MRSEADTSDENLDILNELAAGEDEFDVDLMASACRVPPPASLQLTIPDVVNLYGLDRDRLVILLEALVNETGIDSNRLFELAESVGRGNLVSPVSHAPLSGSAASSTPQPGRIMAPVVNQPGAPITQGSIKLK